MNVLSCWTLPGKVANSVEHFRHLRGRDTLIVESVSKAYQPTRARKLPWGLAKNLLQVLQTNKKEISEVVKAIAAAQVNYLLPAKLFLGEV